MEKIIAKCGLVCSDCPAYQATINNDDSLRKKTAENWSKMFNASVDWKTVNCLGCQEQAKDKLFGHCLVCEIRLCANEKNYLTCADCSTFGCEKVKQVWNHDQNAKKRLEALRG